MVRINRTFLSVQSLDTSLHINRLNEGYISRKSKWDSNIFKEMEPNTIVLSTK